MPLVLIAHVIRFAVVVGVAVVALVPRVSSAQDSEFPKIDINAQLRERSEIDARDFSGDSDTIVFHLLRTRVGLLAAANSKIRVFAQVQDSRVFGSGDPRIARGTMDGKAPELDFHQAYFEVDSLFNSPLSARVGRQELFFGNERLIGAVGWDNVGRTFDAGRLTYRFAEGSGRLDAFASRIVGTRFESSGQNFYGLWGTFGKTKALTIEAFTLLDNNSAKIESGPDAGDSQLQRFTGGTYLHGAPGRLAYEFELAYQGGSQAQDSLQPSATIEAYMASGSVGYTVLPKIKGFVRLLYTRLSGDGDPSDNKARTFSTLFATNHKFYGYMDYFPRTLRKYGLQDYSILGSVAAARGLRLTAELHHFMVAETFQGENLLGHELDLSLLYNYDPNLTFIYGASAFAPGGAMKIARGDNTTYWMYFMFIVNV
ncbi:MAG: alginate export family protein [Rhodothermia bacterium]